MAITTVSVTGTATTGTWYFIVAWHDSVNNTLNIQVNNGTANSASYSSGVLDGTADFALGARCDTLPNYFDGRVDAVGLWKRVLTSGEHTSLYNSGTGCQYPFGSCPPPGGLVSRAGGLYSIVPVHTSGGNFGERPLSRASVLALTAPPTGQTWHLYYFVGAQRVAMREQYGSSDALYYLVGDDLGSTSVALDSSRHVVSEARYFPFGEAVPVTGTLPTDHQFTGQLRDVPTGLYDYGARWYDPYLNRWIQPDTIVPGAGNPQALNRYSYTNGNPLSIPILPAICQLTVANTRGAPATLM